MANSPYLYGDKLQRFFAEQNAKRLGIQGPMSASGITDALKNAGVPDASSLNKLYSNNSANSIDKMLNTVATPAKKKHWWSNWRSKAAPAADVAADAVVDAGADAIGKGGSFFGNVKNNLGNTWNNVKSGKGAVPKYAKTANTLSALYAAYKLTQGLSEYGTAKSDTDNLVSDILASAGGNPNLRYDLSADQLSTLRKLQNGNYDTYGDFDPGSLLGSLGDIAMGAGLGFVTGGGPWGAVIGGLGGAADAITGGMTADQQRITADLESLYNALYESEMRNKQMKRDVAMQRYANSLYA